MTRTIWLVAWLLVGLPCLVSAQTTATAGSKWAWDQAAPDLATAQAYTYTIYVDGAATGTVVVQTCTGVSPISCLAPLPVLTAGAHTAALSAKNVAGESPKTAALPFTFVTAPGAPTNLYIQ